MKKRIITVLGILFTLLLAGCSSKSDENSAAGWGYPSATMASTTQVSNDGIFSEDSYEYKMENETTAGTMSDGTGMPDGNNTEEGSGASDVGSDSARKLIRSADLEVETLEYETFMAQIENTIKGLSGYVESMENYNRSFYSSSSLRSASITARIPQQNLDTFLDTVGNLGNVTNESKRAQDITMNYVDTESRKKALEIEQERLLALLEKADKIEDIIALEERLSNVRYELERNARQLRTYDNLVDYSTVTLSIQEVREVTKEEPVTLGKKMARGFSDTLSDIAEGAKNFAVWFVTNLVYLVFWGIVIAVVIIAVKKKIRKHRAKKSGGKRMEADVRESSGEKKEEEQK